MMIIMTLISTFRYALASHCSQLEARGKTFELLCSNGWSVNYNSNMLCLGTGVVLSTLVSCEPDIFRKINDTTTSYPSRILNKMKEFPTMISIFPPRSYQQPGISNYFRNLNSISTTIPFGFAADLIQYASFMKVEPEAPPKASSSSFTPEE